MLSIIAQKSFCMRFWGVFFGIMLTGLSSCTQEKINNSVGLVGANQLYLLSHQTEIEGKQKIHLEGTVYGVDYNTVVENLEPSTSPMVRGDELMDLLQLIVNFLIQILR